MANCANCNDGQFCFFLVDGPKCAPLKPNPSPWVLNNESFPPITYLGNVSDQENAQCEIFDYSKWSESDIDWLLDFFYENWVTGNEIPKGSFVRPLDYLGSCSGKLENGLPSLYCSSDQNICMKKLVAKNCNSSNQCMSANCGNIQATSFLNGTIIPNANTSCINDSTSAILTDNGTRTIFLTDNLVEAPNNNNTNSGPGGWSIVIIIIVVIFVTVSLCCFAKRQIKQGNRRQIVSPAGDRDSPMHRGASVSLNRNGSLNRSNSVRTLPQYSAVAEEVAYQPGVVSSIYSFFFPPGELPPPYESVQSTEDIRRISTLNYVSDVQRNSTLESITENAGEETMISENDSIKDEDTVEPITVSEVRDGVILEAIHVTQGSVLPNDNGDISTEPHTLPEAEDAEESDVFVMQERRESEIQLTGVHDDQDRSDENA